ncbi:MAG: GNAT family N-acetyltransferase, partial [Clostridiales bacterium]|nr:GNAT family N-acetyltransferase [Clostridiales bacterium]
SVGISVISKCWGKGLGTIMMNALEKQAKTMGISQMELEFIEGNDRAKCLYEKLGYRVTGELPNAIHSREGMRLGMFTMIKEI